MIQLRFDIKQLRIDDSQQFVWCVKYANMEGFRRAMHILNIIVLVSQFVVVVILFGQRPSQTTVGNESIKLSQ